MGNGELESLKQKFSEIEKRLNDIDLDKVSSKKGSKLKDRKEISDIENLKQRLSDIESILEDIPDIYMSKKGSKLKDR